MARVLLSLTIGLLLIGATEASSETKLKRDNIKQKTVSVTERKSTQFEQALSSGSTMIPSAKNDTWKILGFEEKKWKIVGFFSCQAMAWCATWHCTAYKMSVPILLVASWAFLLWP
jgi:hypothetical protein